MITKKKIGLFMVGVSFLLVFSCRLHADEADLFDFRTKLVTNEGTEFYEKAGLDVIFVNNGKKVISKFEIAFYLFDENGEPFINSIYKVEGSIKTNAYVHVILNLDEFFDECDPKKCSVDFVYINKIVFEDGTIYTDPYGLKYFTRRER